MDYIDGDFFSGLAGCKTYDRLPDRDIITLYSTTDHYERAIRFIANNPDKEFKLITHNSDKCVEYGFIPDNLVKWYAQNLNFQHPKLEPLPIGFENNHWHPQKRLILDNLDKHNNKRKLKALAQFNPATFPSERGQLLSDVLNGKIFADAAPCINGQWFDQYANNLTNYSFCLCPRGNGIDTHRVWEAIYLGCIPIVKNHITHKFEYGLPIVFVEDWQEVTQSFLQQKITDFDFGSFDSPLLTQEYWKNRICNM
jgi:hypothetical protein